VAYFFGPPCQLINWLHAPDSLGSSWHYRRLLQAFNISDVTLTRRSKQEVNTTVRHEY